MSIRELFNCIHESIGFDGKSINITGQIPMAKDIKDTEFYRPAADKLVASDLFSQRLLDTGFTVDQIKTIWDVIDKTCTHCWNGDKNCQCWNDE